MYLVQMTTGVFTELYARGSLIVGGDATQTAQNIVNSEPLFRIGIASDLATYIAVLLATWALYVLLRPIDRNLALLAVFFRLMELAIHFNVTLNSLAALRLLSGADYLKSFETSQLHSLVQLALGIQGAGMNTGFVLLGLGSAVFAYLLFRSRYIPRLLAVGACSRRCYWPRLRSQSSCFRRPRRCSSYLCFPWASMRSHLACGCC